MRLLSKSQTHTKSKSVSSQRFSFYLWGKQAQHKGLTQGHTRCWWQISGLQTHTFLNGSISSLSRSKSPASDAHCHIVTHALISRKFPASPEEFSKDDPKFKSCYMCFLFSFIKKNNWETVSLTKLGMLSFPDYETRPTAVGNYPWEH